ncbi:MAG: hypothetical protein ACRC26_10900, partial [Bacteroidales bacterium]
HKNMIIHFYNRLLRLLIIALPVYLTGCKTIDPLVKNLFLTTERVEIALPKDEDGENSILTENIESHITAESEVQKDDQHQTDSVRMIDLKEVSVVADKVRIKRIVDEKGWLNLFFEIKTPAVLLDSTWQLTITPEMRLRDTIRYLPPLILQGSAFKAKQEEQQEAYKAFLDSIVPQEKYADLFLDQKKITEDIALRRWLLYKSYNREISKRHAYKLWRKKQEKADAIAKQKFIRDKQQILQNFKREQGQVTFETLLARRDTSGLESTYSRKVKAALKGVKEPDSISLKRVPNKYKAYYENDLSTMNLENRTLSYADSVQIALNRFKWDEIAINEYNKENADLIKKSMITLPDADSSIMTITANPDNDFKFMYHHRIPLIEGLRKFDICLNSMIVALDETSFKVTPSDTITFVIASIAELYDRTLIETCSDSALYTKGIHALESRYYAQAITLLEPFNDFNYALALACDGKSERADLVLSQLSQNAKTLYLRSILNTRLKNYQQASEFLISAIKSQPQLIHRTSTDPEIIHLLEVARNLKDIITELSQQATN